MRGLTGAAKGTRFPASLEEVAFRGEPVAQLVEHDTFNVGVPGSSPGGLTSFFGLHCTAIVRLRCTYGVAGDVEVAETQLRERDGAPVGRVTTG